MQSVPKRGREFLHCHDDDEMDDDDYEDGEDYEDAVDDEDDYEDDSDDDDKENKDDVADDDMDEGYIGWNLLQQFLVLLSTSQCVLRGHL